MKKLGMLLVLWLTMVIGSHRVIAQSVTITLMPGWNWISSPTTDTLDLATAMGSFTPAVGDIIKSQWASSTYLGNGQWRGSISQFYPGYGYKYYSYRTMPVMLTFNAQQPAPQVIVTTMEPTNITTNSATCGGTVASSDENYVFVILRGICWSTNPNPTFNDNYVEVGNGLGSFTASMIDLSTGTTYYVRAFAVTAMGTFYGEEMNFTTFDGGGSNTPLGAINGLFTINENGDQIYFSQGNLQYIGSATTPYWKFADHQWDYLGTTTGQDSGSENVDRDLFGWGTSGYHDLNDQYNVNYQPWSTSSSLVNPMYNYYGYGPSTNMTSLNLTSSSANYDWGVFNPISNGGNIANQWRTLTAEEWEYVCFTRNTATGIRYVKANLNGINGLVLLPDDWDVNIFNTNGSFNSNIISAAEWETMENAGAVFLPCAGGRTEVSVTQIGSYGWYWSTSYGNYKCALPKLFYNEDVCHCINFNKNRSLGLSVRLVQDYQP